MKNVIFYTYSKWAFGTIHYELSKYLFNEGFNCQVLPWEHHYISTEIQNLDNTTDIWMSTFDGILDLHKHGIHLSKCVVITHSIGDLHWYDANIVKQLKSYGCISNKIRNTSIELNHMYIPKLCSLGINYNTFFTPPSDKLETVGYAGSYCDKATHDDAVQKKDIGNHYSWKRGHLVQECAENNGFEFKLAVYNTTTNVSMAGFYKSVDCVIMSSTELEAGGLPVLEAGAAGKLVIGTPVGHWDDLIGSKGGIEVPIPEQEFKKKVVEILTFYKNNQTEYKNRCLQIQEHAKSYDWSNVIHQWVDILK